MGRHAEQKHDFIQSSDFGARRIAATGPGVRLAFHQYRRVFTAKVKFVRFLDSGSYWGGESGLKGNASFGEEEPSRFLKLSAHMCIADRADTLKVVLHPRAHYFVPGTCLIGVEEAED